jgi:hypothetical protein
MAGLTQEALVLPGATRAELGLPANFSEGGKTWRSRAVQDR